MSSCSTGGALPLHIGKNGSEISESEFQDTKDDYASCDQWTQTQDVPLALSMKEASQRNPNTTTKDACRAKCARWDGKKAMFCVRVKSSMPTGSTAERENK
jgi:hypothetical protein